MLHIFNLLLGILLIFFSSTMYIYTFFGLRHHQNPLRTIFHVSILFMYDYSLNISVTEWFAVKAFFVAATYFSDLHWNMWHVLALVVHIYRHVIQDVLPKVCEIIWLGRSWLFTNFHNVTCECLLHTCCMLDIVGGIVIISGFFFILVNRIKRTDSR